MPPMSAPPKLTDFEKHPPEKGIHCHLEAIEIDRAGKVRLFEGEALFKHGAAKVRRGFKAAAYQKNGVGDFGER